MQLLSFNFFIYSVAGIWRPVECTSYAAKLLYNSFSLYLISSLYFLMATQLLDIILFVDNVDDLVINSQVFVSMIAVCCKATVVLTRRDTIIGSVRTLLEEPCRPRDKDEVAIQTKFDEFIRLCSIKYSLLAATSVTGVTVGSVLGVMHGDLPYRVWLPFDPDTTLMFWFTSVQQIVTVILATIINVGTETLVFGFLLQTCAQLEIFESRLHRTIINKTVGYSEYSSSKNERKGTLSEHIRHHLCIYDYAKTINNIFSQILFTQFFGSILVLCTNVYYLSTHITESEAAAFLIYTICMIVQIYIYCWSGNEVIQKSTSIGNAIFHMDWPSLSVTEKKDLLMIMRRSTLPIKFTSSFLINLSLESFSNILKMSYTVFNLLQQS